MVSGKDESKVLYIEDNLINQELMGSIFDELEGVRLEFAEDAESGIELAKTGKPDLILMDIGLPGMDGITATRILKDTDVTSDIPVIAVSAAAMETDRQRAEGAGFYAYTTKPFNVLEIMQLVDKVLQGDS